jgi:LytS/YehU family sensor histidine kinase
MIVQGKKSILIHVLGSIAFLLLPIIFSPNFSLRFDFLKHTRFQHEMLYFFMLLLFFYIAYYLLIPNFFDKKKYVHFFISLVIIYVLLSWISVIKNPKEMADQAEGALTVVHHKENRGINAILFHEFNHHLFKFLIVLVSAMLISINNKLKKIAKEKVEAELSFLKAQIKPHFLFNTLNSIYSLAIQKSNEVPQAIALFSVMLRYITNEAHKNFIPINKELGYISSYVGLQKLRFENTVSVEFYIEGSTDEREIAPLLLSTFVENAFKYGVNPEKKSVIKISVFVSESEIYLTVFNNKVIDHKTQITEGGLGLENVKKRLDLLYPNLHELEINDDKESYSILLKIKLK